MKASPKTQYNNHNFSYYQDLKSKISFIDLSKIQIDTPSNKLFKKALLHQQSSKVSSKKSQQQIKHKPLLPVQKKQKQVVQRDQTLRVFKQACKEAQYRINELKQQVHILKQARIRNMINIDENIKQYQSEKRKQKKTILQIQRQQNIYENQSKEIDKILQSRDKILSQKDAILYQLKDMSDKSRVHVKTLQNKLKTDRQDYHEEQKRMREKYLMTKKTIKKYSESNQRLSVELEYLKRKYEEKKERNLALDAQMRRTKMILDRVIRS